MLAAPGCWTHLPGRSPLPCGAQASGQHQARAPPAGGPPPQRQRRPQRRRVAATATQPSGQAEPQPRHFLRPSLLATGLSEPQDVLQHCLALFRKADLAALQQYLPDSYACAPAGAPDAAGSRPALPVGPWLQVEEQGPLAALAGVLDVGARRVLPGHLLRRSQVVSTLRLAPDAFQQRVALTACSGETSVFEWLLRWYPDAGGSAAGGAAAAAPAAGGGEGGSWVLESVRRDASADLPLPSTPHPTAAPEAVVRAQLAALQQGDVLGASCYSMWHRKGMSSRKTSLGFHHDALRSQLLQAPHDVLLGHAGAQLGAGVLPTQRHMLQHVSVLGADGGSAQFVWRLGMSTHGCWMVSGIFAAEALRGDNPQQQPWP